MPSIRYTRGGRGLWRSIKNRGNGGNNGGDGGGGLIALIIISIIILICVLAPIGACIGAREKEKRQQELAEKLAKQEQERIDDLRYITMSFGRSPSDYGDRWQFGCYVATPEKQSYVSLFIILNLYDEFDEIVYTDYDMTSLGMGDYDVVWIKVPKKDIPPYTSFKFEKSHKKPIGETGKIDNPHNYIFVSSTANCTTSGAETYKCTHCDKIYTRQKTAPLHEFVNDRCKICGTNGDIAKLNSEQKDYLCDEFLKVQPKDFSNDSLSGMEENMLTAKEKTANALQNLKNIEQSSTIMQFNAATGNWERLPNPTYYKPALEKYEKAEKEYYKACELYAWIYTRDRIDFRANTTNATLTSKFNEIINGYIDTTKCETTYIPEWYNNIVNSIKNIIGVDITK